MKPTKTILDKDGGDDITESWICVDCGVNTAPGTPAGDFARMLLERDGSFNARIDEHTEMYMVKDAVWEKAGMKPFGGCLCIGCLEARLGRRLRPKDFDRTSPLEFTEVGSRGTPQLLDRRGR
jgi:hypothetical protein